MLAYRSVRSACRSQLWAAARLRVAGGALVQLPVRPARALHSAFPSDDFETFAVGVAPAVVAPVAPQPASAAAAEPLVAAARLLRYDTSNCVLSVGPGDVAQAVLLLQAAAGVVGSTAAARPAPGNLAALSTEQLGEWCRCMGAVARTVMAASAGRGDLAFMLNRMSPAGGAPASSRASVAWPAQEAAVVSLLERGMIEVASRQAAAAARGLRDLSEWFQAVGALLGCTADAATIIRHTTAAPAGSSSAARTPISALADLCAGTNTARGEGTGIAHDALAGMLGATQSSVAEFAALSSALVRASNEFHRLFAGVSGSAAGGSQVEVNDLLHTMLCATCACNTVALAAAYRVQPRMATYDHRNGFIRLRARLAATEEPLLLSVGHIADLVASGAIDATAVADRGGCADADLQLSPDERAALVWLRTAQVLTAAGVSGAPRLFALRAALTGLGELQLQCFDKGAIDAVARVSAPSALHSIAAAAGAYRSVLITVPAVAAALEPWLTAQAEALQANVSTFVAALAEGRSAPAEAVAIRRALPPLQDIRFSLSFVGCALDGVDAAMYRACSALLRAELTSPTGHIDVSGSTTAMSMLTQAVDVGVCRGLPRPDLDEFMTATVQWALGRVNRVRIAPARHQRAIATKTVNSNTVAATAKVQSLEAQRLNQQWDGFVQRCLEVKDFATASKMLRTIACITAADPTVSSSLVAATTPLQAIVLSALQPFERMTVDEWRTRLEALSESGRKAVLRIAGHLNAVMQSPATCDGVPETVRATVRNMLLAHRQCTEEEGNMWDRQSKQTRGQAARLEAAAGAGTDTPSTEIRKRTKHSSWQSMSEVHIVAAIKAMCEAERLPLPVNGHWVRDPGVDLDVAWPELQVAVQVQGPSHYLPLPLAQQVEKLNKLVVPGRRAVAGIVSAGVAGVGTTGEPVPADMPRQLAMQRAGWRVIEVSLATEMDTFKLPGAKRDFLHSYADKRASDDATFATVQAPLRAALQARMREAAAAASKGVGDAPAAPLA